MPCLREINRFLNRLLYILPVAEFAPSHHFWSPDRSSLLETPTAEKQPSAVIKRTEHSKTVQVQAGASPLRQLSLVSL